MFELHQLEKFNCFLQNSSTTSRYLNLTHEYKYFSVFSRKNYV